MPGRHPTKLCSCCWKFVERSSSAYPSSRLPQTDVVPTAEWPECEGDACTLCEHWKQERKGGRPPKSKAGRRGRPKGGGGKAKADAIPGPVELQATPTAVELPADPVLASRVGSFVHELPLYPERFVGHLEDDLLCPVCKNILNRPVAVPVPGCEHACCIDCWKQWLAVQLSCPVCRKEVACSGLQPLPRVLWLQLSRLEVHCDYWQQGCKSIMTLPSYAIIQRPAFVKAVSLTPWM